MSKSQEKALKAHISGFLHYRLDLGDGMQTAVYFDTCRGKCRSFCAGRFLCEHPTEYDVPERDTYTPDELIEYLFLEQKWCASRKISILFTGGEPLADPWYCRYVARGIKKWDMGVIFRTCGAVSAENLYIVAPYTDLYLLDMITVIPSAHKRLTGFSFQSVMNALEMLERYELPYRLRFRILPGINDTAPDVLAAFCKTLPCVKSVILDFSGSGFDPEKIRHFKEPFLNRGVILY